MKDLIVIIPFYNEEEGVALCLRSWVKALESLAIDYEIHCYNDGSKDRTKEILEKWPLLNPKVIVKTHSNCGHGPTILKGYHDAFKKSEWVLQVDSDNEINPGHFINFWKERESYDYIQGIRIDRKQNWKRKILSLCAFLVSKFLFKSPLKDPNIPFRLIKNKILEEKMKNVSLDLFAPNIILSAYVGRDQQLKILQLEVPFEKRRTGEESIPKGIKIFKLGYKVFKQTTKYL